MGEFRRVVGYWKKKNFKRYRYEYVIGFNPNRIMGKYSKSRVRVWGEQKEFGRGGIIPGIKEMQVLLIPSQKLIYVESFI